MKEFQYRLTRFNSTGVEHNAPCSREFEDIVKNEFPANPEAADPIKFGISKIDGAWTDEAIVCVNAEDEDTIAHDIDACCHGGIQFEDITCEGDVGD